MQASKVDPMRDVLGAHRHACVRLFALAVCALASAAVPAEFPPPARITVVTDNDYPPYLFTVDGELRGIVKDKWNLWSRKTGVAVTLKGMEWSRAQSSVQDGSADVIDVLSYTDERTRLYEYSRSYAPVRAYVYFHRGIGGIGDVASMRGFTIGAKAASACGDWLVRHGIDSIRAYPTSEALIQAAGRGEVRLFCMDAIAAQYYLYRYELADEFHASRALYATRFHWAVKKGRAELRDFIQRGFDQIDPAALRNIDDDWMGNPLRFPIATRYLHYLAGLAAVVLLAYAALLLWNRGLRARVNTRTAELNEALLGLRQAVSAGNVGLFDWDIRSGRVRYSPEWKRQIGYEDHEISDNVSEWRRRLHPEDVDRALSTVQEYLERRWPRYQLEFRFRHKNGSYRWILAQSALHFGADGRPVRMLGAHVDITERKQSEALLRGQKQVLEHIAVGAPLGDTLNMLVRVIEDQVPEMICSILLLDPDGQCLHHGACVRLPEEFVRAIDGGSIGPRAGSCGTAAFRGEPVIVEDIRTDPLWDDYRELALRHGFLACWSTPIFDAQRHVLGTFAFYYRAPGRPTTQHERLVDMVAHTAAIAIVQERERKALRASEERLRLAVSGGNVGIWEWIEESGELVWSDKLKIMFGLDPADTARRSSLESVHPDDRARVQAAFRDALANRTEYAAEYRVVRPDGSERWIVSKGRGDYDADGRPVRMLGAAVDITERKQAEEKVDRLNRVYAMLSGINSVIVRVRDLDELFREACRLAVVAGKFRLAWIGILDHAAGRLRPVASSGADEEFLAKLDAVVRQDVHEGRGVVTRVARTGRAIVSNDIERDPQVILARELMATRGVRSLAALPLVVSGEVVGVITLLAAETGFFDDAEMNLLFELAGDIAFGFDHIRKEERINYLAYYDSLTGLANHTLFDERLTQFIQSAQQAGRSLALGVVDIDHFKNVNDALGRHAGDALLAQFAQRLAACAQDVNQVARLGADRFAVVMADVGDENGALVAVERKLPLCIGAPFRVADTDLRIAVKIGMARYPEDGADAKTLFANAEAALKYAKAGGERYMFYRPEMTERIGEKLTLENKLRRALEGEEFVLHYQLKVNARTRHIVGVEALLRWRDVSQPELVLPADFVPLLEENGMIVDVGAWAIRRAVQDYTDWRELGLAAPRIAVNVSTVQLRQHDFVDMVRNALGPRTHPVPIDIEVTETQIMKDIEVNIGKLDEIRRLGANIAVDDFGTGYSSLGYLARLPVQVLKIDVTFVARMLLDSGAMTLVTTMISLAHSLGLKVVAEGVETEEQARALRDLGCDELQGYLISPPLPHDEVTRLLLQKPVRRVRS